MEQLVKFISDSISDMTCKGVTFDQPASSFAPADRKPPDPKQDGSWMALDDQGDSCRNEDKLEELKSCSLGDPGGDIFGVFSSADDVRGFSMDETDWGGTSRQGCCLVSSGNSQHGFTMEGCKFQDGNDASSAQDVVQQSQVSSSKSPSVLANDIIGPLLLEALDGFLFMVDKRNEIQFISENVTQYLKYTKEDLIGNSIFNLIHSEDHSFFTQALDLLMFEPSCKSPCFTCRMLVKQPGKGQPTYDRMQITTTLQSYPFDSKSNPGDQLVACVARRIGVPSKPSIVPSVTAEIEQFTTKQDVKGVILDTCGLNPDNFGFLNLIGQNIQNFCHVNDKPQLFKHHREVLSSGTNTSGVYRFKLKEGKYVFVQTKSQLFKNPANPKLDFVMSTHSIVKECCDDNELKGTASSSLVKAIIGQAGSKQKMRQTPEETMTEYPPSHQFFSCSQSDLEASDPSSKIGHPQYYRGGRGHSAGGGELIHPGIPSKPRGRGERLTTRPVGRPRLHPGGFTASRLHNQYGRSEPKQDCGGFGRDGCPPSVYLGHHQRRRRRQHQHLPRSNSMTMAREVETYPPCPGGRHPGSVTATNSAEDVACFGNSGSKGGFGIFDPHSHNQHLQQQQQHQRVPKKDFLLESSADNIPEIGASAEFLPAADQSFLDELLAETSELGGSLLSDDFCMDFDESILDEMAKQDDPSTNVPPRGFDFSIPDNFGKSSVSVERRPQSAVFKQTDFRGTLGEDRTHLADLLLDGQSSTLEQSKRDTWSLRLCTDKRKDRGSTGSNIILKKLLSQDDEEDECEEDSGGSPDGSGRVLALLAGTGIGEVFPGGICKQLKKELENSSKNTSRSVVTDESGHLTPGQKVAEDTARTRSACEDTKKFFPASQTGDGFCCSTQRSIEEALGGPFSGLDSSAQFKDRQNMLLKELLNEKSTQSTPVQSKLLKSLLASDEANFDVLEEKCNSESNVGLLPIVEKSVDSSFFSSSCIDHGSPLGSNDKGRNNDGDVVSIDQDFSASLDFDCLSGCNRDLYEDVTSKKMDTNALLFSLDSKVSDPRPVVESRQGSTRPCDPLASPYSRPSEESNDIFKGARKDFFSSSSPLDKKLLDGFCGSMTPTFSQPVGRSLVNSVAASNSLMFFSAEQSDRSRSSAEARLSRKNVLLAQLLSRTSDDVLLSGVSAATSTSCSSVSSSSVAAIFPTRNASSIAVVTPMVHLLKQNKNCSSPSMASSTMGSQTGCKELDDQEESEGSESSCKRTKFEDDKVQFQAKPSVSLQPFRCHPTGSGSVRHQQNSFYSVSFSSSCSSSSSSSVSIFSSSSSSMTSTSEIFVPKSQLHYSGGTLEHVNDKIDAGVVGVVPCFDSPGMMAEVAHYGRVKDVLVKKDPQAVIARQSSKTPDSKPLEEKKPRSNSTNFGELSNQNVPKNIWGNGGCQVTIGYKSSPTHPPLGGGCRSEGLHSATKADYDEISQRMISPHGTKLQGIGMSKACDSISSNCSNNSIMDALPRNNGCSIGAAGGPQSSNVCSTRPFIAHPMGTQSSLTSPQNLLQVLPDEDLFSASYSPISPAQQDECSQQEATSSFPVVVTDLEVGTTDVAEEGCRGIEALNTNNDTGSICTTRSFSSIEQQSMGNEGYQKGTSICTEYNARMQMQCSFHLSGSEWTERTTLPQPEQLFPKQSEGRAMVKDQHSFNLEQDKMPRKRLHSEVFVDQQGSADQISSQWNGQQHHRIGSVGNVSTAFSGMVPRHQMLLRKQQMLGDAKRHQGTYPDFHEAPHQQFQGQEVTAYARMQPHQGRFSAVQDPYPPPAYQMERDWGQQRWSSSAGGMCHKPPYMPVGYSSMAPHDRSCCARPQMVEKIMSATGKHPKQYCQPPVVHPHISRTAHPFLGHHQSPSLPQSFPQHYVKHRGGPNPPSEFTSCCNVPNCPADLHGRPSPYELSTYQGHPKPLPTPHLMPQSHPGLFQQQHHHQQQLSQQLPQRQHHFVQTKLRQFPTEAFDGSGRRLRHHHDDARQQHYIQQSFPVAQHQQQMLQQPPASDFVDRSTSFSGSSFTLTDPKSVLLDDSIRIHPDSGLFDFPLSSDEVSSQDALCAMFPEDQDGPGLMKSQQVEPAFNQLASNCQKSSFAALTGSWTEECTSLQNVSGKELIDQNLQCNTFNINNNININIVNNSSINSNINTSSNSSSLKNSIMMTTTTITMATSLSSASLSTVIGNLPNVAFHTSPYGNLLGNPQGNSRGNPYGNSSNSNSSLTKEYLRKELRNICTARSQQQQTASIPQGLQLNSLGKVKVDEREAPVALNRWPEGSTGISRNAFEGNGRMNLEVKTQESSASGRSTQEGGIGEAEDIFKSIGSLSFMDVENDSFWPSLTSSDDKASFNCNDLI